MPRIYENTKRNFSSFDEFKEVAAKTLNEIYGRVRPLDVIDYSQDDTNYKAVGYYDDEPLPAEQKPGEPISAAAAAAEQEARDKEAQHKAQAEKEVADELARIVAAFENKQPVVYEDLVFAHSNGVVIPEEITKQLEDGVKAGKFSYQAAEAAGLTQIDGVPIKEAIKAALSQPVGNVEPAKNLPYNVKQVGDKIISDKALALAEANGVDITKIDGTGRDGTIKVDDVKDYIANHAPAQENADGNDSEQPNA